MPLTIKLLLNCSIGYTRIQHELHVNEEVMFVSTMIINDDQSFPCFSVRNWVLNAGETGPRGTAGTKGHRSWAFSGALH